MCAVDTTSRLLECSLQLRRSLFSHDSPLHRQVRLPLPQQLHCSIATDVSISSRQLKLHHCLADAHPACWLWAASWTTVSCGVSAVGYRLHRVCGEVEVDVGCRMLDD